MDDLDFQWPAVLQVRKIRNFPKWACEPYPASRLRGQIPLFYTEKLGREYPFTQPLRILEALTQGPIWQIPVVWIPLILTLIVSFHPVDPVMVGIGLCSWTFIEYATHRFLFHNKLLTHYLPEVAFCIHYVHHKHPRDIWRLTLPLILSIPIYISIITFLYHTLFGYNRSTTACWSIGFLIGYVIYDICHFFSHFVVTKFHFQKHHLAHHGMCTRKYGFSTSIWDHVFCTDGPSANSFDSHTDDDDTK